MNEVDYYVYYLKLVVYKCIAATIYKLLVLLSNPDQPLISFSLIHLPKPSTLSIDVLLIR